MDPARISIPVALGASLALLACAGSPTGEPSAPHAANRGEAPASGPAAAGAPLDPGQAPALRLGDEVAPLGYQVELDLDPASDHFDGVVTIELTVAVSTDRIWLNGADLEVREATLTVAGAPWPITPLSSPSDDFLGFALGRALPPGQATLRVSYRGHMSTRENNGVFKRVEDGRAYVYTQFEPLAARRAFPCFDEPRFKVPWQLTIHAPEGLMAVTNTPLVDAQADPQSGTRRHRFAPTKPMPSYLIAFAVGPFEAVDLGPIGRERVPARIIVPHGRAAQARYAAEVTPRLLGLLEDYFDLAYPYAKLDSLAIPTFGGAMEHPGLITYSDQLLLAAPAQEGVDFRRAYAGVGLHELAHQWFGNLVTMTWWDDLWLNESFATWMAAKLLAVYEAGWDGEVRARERADRTMLADSFITARRVHQPITHRNDILDAFDAISYGKGSAVLAMFERWVGADAFRAGVRAYVRAHAWKNATADDFLAALAAASKPEVAAAMRTFLDQAGVPALSVDLVCEPGERPALEMAQERFLPAGSAGSTTDRTWHIPVCVEYGRGARTRTQCTLLDEEVDTLELEPVGGCPAWVMANKDAVGYYRVAYGPEVQSALLGPARRHLSVPERYRVASDIAALVTAGKMEMGEFLALVPALLRDPSDHIPRAVVGLVAGVRSHLVPAPLRPNYARYVRKTFGPRARKLGWRPRPGEPEATRLLRHELLHLAAVEGAEPALVAQATRMTETWLESGAGIDVDVLPVVLTAASFHGDEALHQRVEQAIRETSDRRRRRALIEALGRTRDPERVRKNLAFALSGAIDVREAQPLVFGPLAWPESRGVIYDFVKEHYQALIDKLPRRGGALLIGAAYEFCDQAQHDDVEAFFGPKVEQIPSGPKALAETLERIALCTTSRSIQQPSVEAFLRRY